MKTPSARPTITERQLTSSLTAKVCATGGWLGLASVLVVGAGLVWSDEDERAQDRAYWTVTGEPCRAIAASGVAGLPRPLNQAFTFEGRRFWRTSGAAACSGLTERAKHYEVCQFNSPRALAVRTGPRMIFYDVGGRPATVKVGPRDDVACVLAARFNGE